MDWLYISKSRKVYCGLIIELILLFIVSMIMDYRLLLFGILANIGIIIAIYLFYNDNLNLILTLTASFTITYLIENLKMPHSIRYIQDYFILIMVSKLVVCVINRKINMVKIYIPMSIFIVSTLASYFINGGSVNAFLLAWFKDYLRYFVVFLALINLNYTEKNLMKIIKGLWYFLLLQVPVVYIEEVWSLKYWKAVNPGDIRQDYIAGTLGGRGTIELGILLTLGISVLFILYLKKKVKLAYFMTIFTLFLSVICISEIKFAFFLIVFSFLIIYAININYKSSIIVLVSIFFIAIGTQELIKLYPDFHNFLSEQYITEYLNEEYAESGISRADSFIVANKVITKDFASTILGYGAGQADKVSPPYRFSAFNISMYITELGYLGLICFYGIFLSMGVVSIYLIRNGKREFEKTLGTIGLILQIVIVLGTFYNMPMVNITFSIFAWVANGTIYRYYELNKTSDYNKFIGD